MFGTGTAGAQDSAADHALVAKVFAAKGESIKALTDNVGGGFTVKTKDAEYTVLAKSEDGWSFAQVISGATGETWTVTNGGAAVKQPGVVNVTSVELKSTPKPIGGGRVPSRGVYAQSMATICHLGISAPFILDYLNAAIAPATAWCDGIAADIGVWGDFYVIDVGQLTPTHFVYGVNVVYGGSFHWCNSNATTWLYIPEAYADFHYGSGSAEVGGWGWGNYLNCL